MKSGVTHTINGPSIPEYLMSMLKNIVSPTKNTQVSPQTTTTPSPIPTTTPAAPTPTPPYMTIPGYSNGQVPSDIGSYITESAKTYGMNPAVLAATITNENAGFNKGLGKTPVKDKMGNITSYDRYFAQINDKAHPEVSDAQASDPKFAIEFMAKLLAGYQKQFGDLNRAVAAYNVGPGGASIQGPNPYGGGPRGQLYLNKMAKNLDPQLVKDLNLKLTPQYRTDPAAGVVWPK